MIDALTDEQASDLLEDLLGSDDEGGPLLDDEELASLDRGLVDIAADRMISLEEFEREPPIHEWQIQELERRRLNLEVNPGSVTDWQTVKRIRSGHSS